MRLYNLPNNTALTDRERTFFGVSMYSCGIFDYKMSSNTDPSDPGDTGVNDTGFIIPKLSSLNHLRKTLHALGKL